MFLSLSTVDLQNISEQIEQIFVGELATTFYRKYCQGRHASGKLHDAYNNYRTSLASSGLISRRSKTKPIVRELLNLDEGDYHLCCLSFRYVFKFLLLTVHNTAADKKIIENALQTLKTETHIENCVEAWKKTFSLRREQLQSEISTVAYIKQYPALEQPDGHILVSVYEPNYMFYSYDVH